MGDSPYLASAEASKMTKVETRLKILLVTRNFPPLTGGMERLMQNAALGISAYADLTIIGPRGCGDYAPEGATVMEVPASLVPFLLLGTLSSTRACLRQKFDVVVGGSGLTAPTLWIVKKVFKLPTVVFVHGLDLVANHIVYQKMFVPLVKTADLTIANSQNTRGLAIDSGVAADHITVINPGVDLTEITDIPKQDAFVSEHDLTGRKIVLFTGRITPRKGLSAFIKHCLPLVIAAEPETVLLVVGESPEQSLNRKSEADDVVEAVAANALERNVVFLGKVSEDELLKAYAASNVQILPLVNTLGDVEGFGMVAIEAAALGTPTIAFHLGGVSDAISPENGSLVPAGRYDLFAESLIESFHRAAPDSNSCIAHANKFSWEVFDQRIKTAILGALPKCRDQ
jgi:phosphatidyl-myo-inositol dimannoside synthase